MAGDQRQWDFSLSPAARFSDGHAITSADVKSSLERVARHGSGSPGADLLESVSGFSAFAQTGTAPNLAGVTAPSPTVVHVALDRPLSVLPALLGSPTLAIVPQGTTTIADVPIGSGPFKVGSRSPDQIVLQRSPGSSALLDGVELDLYPSAAAAYQAFVDGRVDWSRVPPDDVESASARYGQARFRPYLAELFYGFNLKSPAFADPRFREAIVRAVDRDAIVNAIYHGTVLPLDGVVVRGVPGYQPGVCGDRCNYDPEQSKQLLAAAFPPGGPPMPAVIIDFDDDPTQQAVAKAIAANLTTVGITTTLRSKPLADYQQFTTSGQLQLFHLGWIGAYPSPEAFLGPLFGSGARSNLTNLSDPGIDFALGGARSEPDETKRLSYYAVAEKAIMAQLPVLPIAQYEVPAVIGKRVRNLDPTTTGVFDSAQVWLAS